MWMSLEGSDVVNDVMLQGGTSDGGSVMMHDISQASSSGSPGGHVLLL